MTYRSSNPFDKQDYSKFAFKKSELLEILQAIDSSFSFDLSIVEKPNNTENTNTTSVENLQKLTKTNDLYISVVDVFELIRSKTDLKSDSEIANFLVVNKINDLTIPFDKFKYFDGKPTRLHKDFQQNQLTKMDLLLLEIAREELQLNSNDKRLKSFAWDKFDFFLEFKCLTNIDLDEEVNLSNVEVDNSIQTPDREENNIEQLKSDLPLHIKILAMNDFFTIVESACFISLDEPEKIQAYLDSGNLTYDAWRYGEHMQAVKVIEGAIKAKKLDIDHEGMIPRASLQQFLFDRNHVIAGFNDNLSQQNQSIFGIPILQQAEPNIENQNAEIARLRRELARAQDRIKQLESKPLIEQVEENNLLALIFDESATDRYAPDLVLSIKLWEHIYITNPKSDSHTNKAIKWLENNTGYEVNKKAGSASKIREITTPFVSWGNLRDKNYKK